MLQQSKSNNIYFWVFLEVFFLFPFPLASAAFFFSYLVKKNNEYLDFCLDSQEHGVFDKFIIYM